MQRGADVVSEERICEEWKGVGEEAAPEVNEALRSWDARRARLYLLRDLPCPLCRLAGRKPIPDLAWTGVSLTCPHGHGWSNPDALRADMLARCPRAEAA